MKFDDLLNKIGEFGPFQKRLYFLLCLPAIPIGLQSMIQTVFLLAIPDHRCMIPGMANDTYAVQSLDHQRLINSSIPDVLKHGHTIYSSCRVYSSFVLNDHLLNSTSFSKEDGYATLREDNSTKECDSWVYDKSVYGRTVATDLSMVCARRMLAPHAKMIVMLGMLTGALTTGPLSDTFGRKTMLVVGIFGNVLGSISITWVSSFSVFAVVLFITHAMSCSAYMSAYVFGTELVGPSKRRFTGIIMSLFWSTGNLLVAAVVYFIRDWKYRQLGFALPGILLLSYAFVIPESPRWLLMKDRKEEAKKVIMNMAKANKSILTPDMIDQVVAHEIVDVQPFWKLFKSKILFLRCLIIFFNWGAVGMGFYGLSINIVNMAGNVYVNYLIFNIFEFVAYIMCILLVDRIGRKRLYCVAMLVGGVTCSLTVIPRLVAPEYTWINTILATIGNTGVCAAFGTVYLFSLELFPTVSRNSGMGFSSVFARIGSLASPYVAELGWIVGGEMGENLPLLIFGVYLIAAGLLSLLLPETFNLKLPETIHDGEMLGRSDSEDSSEELSSLNIKSDYDITKEA